MSAIGFSPCPALPEAAPALALIAEGNKEGGVLVI
jgi:hypothetical protein